jgi:hypothetical protein
MGTMHLGHSLLDAKVDKAKKFLELSCRFYGEMNILEANDKLKEAFEFLTPDFMFNSLGNKKYTKLDMQMQKYFDLSLKEVDNMKPIFIVAILTQKALNANGEAMDHQLFKFALSKSIPVDGLESVEDQIEIASKIPYEYQLSLLISALRNVPKFREKSKDLLNDYLMGNIKGVYEKSLRHMGKTKHLLLYDRNKKISDKIVSHLESEPYKSQFFCFGAAHLSGDKGVVAYLKRRGIKLVLIP